MSEIYSSILDGAYKLQSIGKLVEARELYEKILRFEPSNAYILELYAKLCVSLNDYDKAIESFNKVYELNSLDEYKISIAIIYIYKKDYLTAESILSSLNPKLFQDLYDISLCYKLIGNLKKSFEYAKKAYHINNKHKMLSNHIEQLNSKLVGLK